MKKQIHQKEKIPSEKYADKNKKNIPVIMLEEVPENDV